MAHNTDLNSPSAVGVLAVDVRRFPLPSRTILLLVAIVLGALGNLWNTLAGYSGNTDISTSWIAAHHSAWIAATYGAALNAMGIVALLLAVCVLVRSRGATWATIGLAVGTFATFLYAVATAVPMQALATNGQSVVSAVQLQSLVTYMGQHDSIQAGVAFPSFLLLLVTQIAVTVALFRSRTLALWVPILFIAGAVVQVAFADGGLLTAASIIPQTIANVAIGWYAYRRSAANA
jgi:hypothetical protein